MRMTLKDALAPIRDRLEKATPGPLLEREDFDYYQGGTYLGINPIKYLKGSGQYFGKDVCRIESSGDKELFKYAQSDIARLIEAVEVMDQAFETAEKLADDLQSRMENLNVSKIINRDEIDTWFIRDLLDEARAEARRILRGE